MEEDKEVRKEVVSSSFTNETTGVLATNIAGDGEEVSVLIPEPTTDQGTIILDKFGAAFQSLRAREAESQGA